MNEKGFLMTRFIRNQMQTYIAKKHTILLNDRQRNRHRLHQNKTNDDV